MTVILHFIYGAVLEFPKNVNAGYVLFLIIFHAYFLTLNKLYLNRSSILRTRNEVIIVPEMINLAM